MDFDMCYCRLCAELKPDNKLVDLKNDFEKRAELCTKLRRINAATDFDENEMPKTVCNKCITALNKALDFVVAIENSQSTLKQIFLLQNGKTEKRESATGETAQMISVAEFVLDVNVKCERVEECNVSEPDSCSRESRSTTVKEKLTKTGKLDEDSTPLSTHWQTKPNWANYSWLCSYCETLFPTIDELRTHSMEIHKICNPYRCTNCKIRKLKLNSFLTHVERHEKHLKDSCHKCFEQFLMPYMTRKHRNSHLKSKFVCLGCNLTFPDSEELNRHVDMYCQMRHAKLVPSSLISGMSCTVCHKEFLRKGDLNKHVLTHAERTRDHVCEFCGKGFFSKHNLEYHITTHKDERPYKCQICNASFRNPRNLRGHVGTHDNAKPYRCEQCGKCFRLPNQLEHHSIVHTDNLPYVCPHCDKRFRFRSVFSTHLRTHTGVTPYSCTTCHRDFYSWSNYSKHMKCRHGTDIAKKKTIPHGVNPTDANIEEWKKKLMAPTGLGRPRKCLKKVSSPCHQI